jgi:predicted  nucleic acid-binding Zn-ribbon protein
MPGPASLFREIHRLRRYARDLQEQLDRIPRQLKTHQARLQKREDDLRALNDLIKKLKVTASDKEKALKAELAKINRYQEQINQVTSKKEFDALQLEIAHARTECGKLEDQALEALTESDDRTLQVPALEKAVQEARDELTRFQAQAAPRQADLTTQLAQAQKDLAAAETQIPDDLRVQYNRIIASLGADGMAAVKDRTCMACYTEIIAQSQVDLEYDLFVLCGSCGRILYLPTPAKTDSDDEE